ncbi:MAG TPA: [NiFe]-hydrogenase assembly chaperone HybE [Casimicrobiaceae bacterium]
MTDTSSPLRDPSPRLESVFSTVYAEHMRGLAFVNPAVRVEAIAFAPWKGYWLGVMLTPWSMNLVLMPRDPSAWRTLPPGEKRRYTFPAGSFDFISALSDGIGQYLVCSLFSPVLEFADHETARQTAQFAREALFDAANAEPPEQPVGAATPTEPSQVTHSPGPLAELEASLGTPISRRDLMHGRIFGDGDAPRR